MRFRWQRESQKEKQQQQPPTHVPGKNLPCPVVGTSTRRSEHWFEHPRRWFCSGPRNTRFHPSETAGSNTGEHQTRGEQQRQATIQTRGTTETLVLRIQNQIQNQHQPAGSDRHNHERLREGGNRNRTRTRNHSLHTSEPGAQHGPHQPGAAPDEALPARFAIPPLHRARHLSKGLGVDPPRSRKRWRSPNDESDPHPFCVGTARRKRSDIGHAQELFRARLRRCLPVRGRRPHRVLSERQWRDSHRRRRGQRGSADRVLFARDGFLREDTAGQ
mmetsp:Transcript_26261/g.72121  ORF Transcript_26261/g.72121 Transcript_26261/m.72121 type:complete len:274 (-) Transcript_26261:2062-2883(-)